MKHFLNSFLTLIWLHKALCLLNAREFHDAKSVSAFTEIIFRFYAKESSIVNFVLCLNSSESSDELLQKALPTLGESISCQIESCHKLSNQKRRFVVMLIELRKANDMFNHTTPERFDYSGYYLVYALDAHNESSYREKLLKSFFNLFIYNVVILSLSSSNETQLETFYPFTEKNCKSTEPVVINQHQEYAWTSSDFFPSKMNNFHKCNLKVVAFIYEPIIIMEGSYEKNYTLHGSDIEILKAIGSALNFTVEYLFDPEPGAWGLLKDDGEATGGFLKLISKQADVMVGMLSKTYGRSKHITFTSTIVFNPIILLIPAGAPLTPFEKLFQPFQMTVWFCLLFSFSFGSIFVTILTVKPKNKWKIHIIGKEIAMPGLNIINAIVGGSQHILPTKSVARILLMTFILFCLIKRTLYSAYLYQFLQTDSRKPVVSSIDAIIERGFTIYFYPSFDDMLKSFKFYKYGKVIDDSKIESFRMKTLDPTFKGAVVSVMDELLYINKKNFKNFTFRVLNEYLYTGQACWAFPKYSYLAEPFNEKLSAFAENGLNGFLTSKYMDPQYLYIKEAKHGPKKLSLDQLLGGFQVLIGGLVISMLLFCLEKLSYRFKIKLIHKILDAFM